MSQQTSRSDTTDESRINCPECGAPHRKIASLPSRPISMGELGSVAEADKLVYAGPTVIMQSDETLSTTTIVLQTRHNLTAASYFDGVGAWLVTIQDDESSANPDAGAVFNEMVTQCREAGYRCVAQWFRDGEPGGSVPGASEQ